MKADKFAIIGLGNFGMSVARNLAFRGAEVLAIDRDIERVEMLKDEVAYAVALDSTDLKALMSQNIMEMDAVLIAIGENIEGLLLTTVLLLELKTKRIIARAVSAQQRIILEKLGVKEILSPEDEVGLMVAERLLNPNMNSFMVLPDEYQIVEIKVPKKIVKKSVGEINFENHYDLDLIAIKRRYEEYEDNRKTIVDHVVKRPNENTIIEASDVVIILGKSYDIEKFVLANN